GAGAFPGPFCFTVAVQRAPTPGRERLARTSWRRRSAPRGPAGPEAQALSRSTRPTELTRACLPCIAGLESAAALAPDRSTVTRKEERRRHEEGKDPGGRTRCGLARGGRARRPGRHGH